ncbi:patatin family protein [Corynebacterium sp. 320]|nr:patatin family protein [Corynebacterium sp. 320]KAB1552530.1 patatin family protein [Corynebacterium sp. 321]KAB1554255.1 patatin family protein [Corynebacterium sp. 319]KAB3528508.1 patatin family protein [Corynebacterium sp. 250]KAB3540001.1 patatin family protein [Corynebacterium sp. 366]QNP92051.1 patatin family protein [Corynebacterium zhongnanshanii]
MVCSGNSPLAPLCATTFINTITSPPERTSPPEVLALRSVSTNLDFNVTDTALVFEGGAMRAVYSAAVVEALIESDVRFSWVGGNSASTSHVAYYIAREPQRIRDMYTTFPADPRFGGVRTWLRGNGFFNSEFIFGQAGSPGHPLQLDWDKVVNSNVRFRMSGFNPATGETRHWGPEDITSTADFFRHARASSTLPILMPPVILDAQPWFDGAFGPTGGIPIDAAIHDGFDRYLFVLTRTRDYVKSPSRFSSVIRRYYKDYPLLAESMITRHTRYNQAKEHIFELERQGKAYIFAPEEMRVNNGTRNPKLLEGAYRAGLAQARREMPAIREFLGLR